MLDRATLDRAYLYSVGQAGLTCSVGQGYLGQGLPVVLDRATVDRAYL